MLGIVISSTKMLIKSVTSRDKRFFELRKSLTKQNAVKTRVLVESI